MASIKLLIYKNWISLFVIFFLTFFIWHKTLDQTFLGEGYYYFDITQTSATNLIEVWNLDVFAKLLFFILIPIFRDNIYFYQFLQLLTYLFLYTTIYFVLIKITQSKVIALSSTIFFLASFIGSFEMYATGNYQRFVQRVPNLIPFFLSFLYLNRYYFHKEKKYLYISYLLFALSILMGHYTAFLLPLVFIYPFIYTENLKKFFVKTCLISFTFFFITFSLTYFSGQKPNISLISYLHQEKQLLEKIFFQIPITFYPHEFIFFVGKIIFNETKFPYLLTLRLLTWITIFVFFMVSAYFFKVNKKIFKLYSTFTISMILSMALYTFVDDKLNVLKGFSQDRHLFLPTFFSGVIFSLALFKFKKTLYFILIIYVIYNTIHIWENVQNIQYKSDAMRDFTSNVLSHSKDFNENTIFAIPGSWLWPTPMISRLYLPDGAFIVRSDDGWESLIPGHRKQHTYVFDYYMDPESKGKFYDFTNEFRNDQNFEFVSK